MAEQQGRSGLRGENIERAVKGFALKKYKLKPILLNQNSNKWTETYYREGAAALTVNAETFNIKMVARGAAFPHVNPSWTKHTSTNLKFAAEGHVFMEDKLTDAIDVQARTMLRVAESIVNAVDKYIYTQLTNVTGTSGDVAAAIEWNSTTVPNQDPIGDILLGIAAIAANDYDILENGYLIMDNLDYSSLLRNSKVINNPSFKTADVVSNGKVGQICGLTIIVTESVNADEVMLIMGQRAATWKGVVPLTSAVIEDKGIKFTIRSWEIGHIQITDPLGIYTITGTQV